MVCACTKFCSGLTALVFLFALAVPALAAEVKTEHYTLPLSDDWELPQPVQEAEGTIMAVIVNNKDRTAMTLTVVASAMPAKDVAEQTVANMKQAGMKATKPVEKNGSYTFSLEQNGSKGKFWVTSSGKEFSVVNIVGSATDSGLALLKNFKPVNPKLFPKF